MLKRCANHQMEQGRVLSRISAVFNLKFEQTGSESCAMSWPHTSDPDVLTFGLISDLFADGSDRQ